MAKALGRRKTEEREMQTFDDRLTPRLLLLWEHANAVNIHGRKSLSIELGGGRYWTKGDS